MMGSMPEKAEIPGFSRETAERERDLREHLNAVLRGFLEWSFMRRLSRNEPPARVPV
jgi:hypothetical protein